MSRMGCSEHDYSPRFHGLKIIACVFHRPSPEPQRGEGSAAIPCNGSRSRSSCRNRVHVSKRRWSFSSRALDTGACCRFFQAAPGRLREIPVRIPVLQPPTPNGCLIKSRLARSQRVFNPTITNRYRLLGATAIRNSRDPSGGRSGREDRNTHPRPFGSCRSARASRAGSQRHRGGVTAGFRHI